MLEVRTQAALALEAIGEHASGAALDLRDALLDRGIVWNAAKSQGR